MQLHLFSKGEQIYKAGTKTDYVYFIVKGKFKVLTVQKNEKSILLRFYEPFQMLGDIELFGYVYPLCTLEALNEVICLDIPVDVIRHHCMDDTNFLNYVAKSLAKKLIESSTSSSINLSYPLENRLSSYRHLGRTLNKLYSKNLIKKEKNYIEILDREGLEKLAGDLYK